MKTGARTNTVRLRPGRPRGGSCAGAALAALACLLGLGCARQEPTPVGGRGGSILATSSFGTLEARIPEPIPVRSVLAAAEGTMRDRGYTIVSRRTTDELGRLEARPPSRTLGGRWIVEARAVGSGETALSVRGRGWDDDGAARILMDAILQRLGR